MTDLYHFQQIRRAILKERPSSLAFPFEASTGPNHLEQLRHVPHLKSLIAEIRDEADRCLDSSPPELPFSTFIQFERNGDRKQFEKQYFGRRRRLSALTLASFLFADESDRYIAALEDEIWRICDEYSWALPAHLRLDAKSGSADKPVFEANRVSPERTVDLFAAETAWSLAETLRLLGDRLHPWVGHRIRSEIETRVFQPLFHDPVHFWWESAAMNWAAVCAGGTGMAALLLIDDRERLAGMIDRVVRAMECFLEGFGEDGGCAEGIGYWQYGFGFFVYFAEMLYACTSGEIDLLRGEKIRAIAEFPYGVSLSDGMFVNFSDASLQFRLSTGLLSRLKNRLEVRLPVIGNVPSFHDDLCYRLPILLRELLWTEKDVLQASVPEGSVYYPDLSWAVDRRFAGGGAVAFAAKGGHNDEPHNHNDLGHFIIHAGGENLLADIGVGAYSRQYFSDQRYTILNNASEGHSVPIIGGKQQQAGREYRAEILHAESRTDGFDFSLDLTRAYGEPMLKEYIRSFEWSADCESGSARLNLTDRFCFQGNTVPVDEIFVSFVKPLIDAGKIVWQGSGGAVTMRYEDTMFRASVEPLPMTDNSGNSHTVYRLRLHAKWDESRLEQVCRFMFECQFPRMQPSQIAYICS